MDSVIPIGIEPGVALSEHDDDDLPCINEVPFSIKYDTDDKERPLDQCSIISEARDADNSEPCPVDDNDTPVQSERSSGEQVSEFSITSDVPREADWSAQSVASSSSHHVPPRQENDVQESHSISGIPREDDHSQPVSAVDSSSKQVLHVNERQQGLGPLCDNTNDVATTSAQSASHTSGVSHDQPPLKFSTGRVPIEKTPIPFGIEVNGGTNSSPASSVVSRQSNTLDDVSDIRTDSSTVPDSWPGRQTRPSTRSPSLRSMFRISARSSSKTNERSHLISDKKHSKRRKISAPMKLHSEYNHKESNKISRKTSTTGVMYNDRSLNDETRVVMENDPPSTETIPLDTGHHETTNINKTTERAVVSGGKVRQCFGKCGKYTLLTIWCIVLVILLYIIYFYGKPMLDIFLKPSRDHLIKIAQELVSDSAESRSTTASEDEHSTNESRS